MPSLRGGPCLASLAWVAPGSTGFSQMVRRTNAVQEPCMHHR
jgi:hypothetical protein